ncbi:MAG: T9SS type A sorting domain-containing protein [Candidatus Eisenbacteria sp.]|nr:T9SS type A sorting domain-containing protein [Candidatus Eisenbacteria bacterium]
MRSLVHLLGIIAASGILCLGVAWAEPCIAPDNGTGTIDFPPNCPYDHPADPMMLIDGLPPGTTIELHGPLTNFHNVVNVPGGSLGGEICTFNAFFEWEAIGTGDLTGFHRYLIVPVEGEMHIGPRNPGDPIQSFPADLYRLTGELFGDPDFCVLRIVAGSDYGLPGPGETTLTQLPSGDFAVDSFFDITYQIEFLGCPGSPLEGFAGITVGTALKFTQATYTIDWCRLQWPHTIEEYPGTPVTVYGRLYIAGLTDQTSGNDPIPGTVLGQVGYGADGTDPSSDPSWTWVGAIPNPGWIDTFEPGNDEYMGDLTTPATPGAYDYAFRFSGDGGMTWTYADKDTGIPGEDGSENGYQVENAGQMTVTEEPCCIAPDNGAGTIDYPPDCPFEDPDDPMMIIDGLPPGTWIELRGPLTEFINVVNTPGGTLGGEVCTFQAAFGWAVVGQGDLTGFNRHIWIPVTGEIHIGPRNPGDPVQLFQTRLYSLQGELFGDPDFCELRIQAGEANGLPCPFGTTTLTELPSGDFAVDSFFDITYEIEFEGCPGSVLDSYMGTTQDHVRPYTCEPPTTYTVDWCRLQWPLVIEEDPETAVTIYGHLFIDGLTNQSSGNDPVPGTVLPQIGYGPPDSDPNMSTGWVWFDATPNPGWNDAGEPGNDEYMATILTPSTPGDYDYAYRFSGGGAWTYADKDTGLPGEDGSENGYQVENAGKMTVIAPPCCVGADNGSGTIDYPPDCPHANPAEPMMIINGLPPGTTIELSGPITDIFNVVNTPGGSLGGEICTFDASLDLTVTGTGSLTGFNRHLSVSIECEVHIAPRTPGDPVQSFATKLVDMTGELFGDPDFCTFRVTAGSDHGLPSPGYTTLTQLPSGDFAVDSFFDITYEIEFEGCPGSQLDAYAGTTEDSVTRFTCERYDVDWCRLQWPLTIENFPSQPVTVYGHLYIAGVTDRSSVTDPVPGVVLGQVGYGADGTDPSVDPAAWTWFDAAPNPAWNDASEPNNDEYMATMFTPATPGEYDYAYRFSGDAGVSWTYADKATGALGEDGSENGYQVENAGQMTVWGEPCCLAPDNGTGTVDFPADCPYEDRNDPMMIIDGLPPGTWIELSGPWTSFTNVVNVPGGTLGGEICTFDAVFDWTVTGQGDLTGFNRHIYMAVDGEIHIGPRTPGDPAQMFDQVVYRLDGELFGDPDFCTLRIRAGSDFGLPCPGQTLLVEAPSGDFNVDSFFDITYQIEFEGCPGSVLDSYAGTTTHTVNRATCDPGQSGVDAEELSAAALPTQLYLRTNVPNPFAHATRIAYGIPEHASGSRVVLKVYDAAGRVVRTLINEDQSAGVYDALWSGRDQHRQPVATGIYFYRLSVGGEDVSKRMTVVK